MNESTNIIELDDKELKRYQQCLFEITKDFVDVCDKNGLDYSLIAGSVLGAIRHKGFIPWDDDVDICMPRASYNQLLTIFDSELGGKYYLQIPDHYPEMGILVTQVRKRNTVARRKFDWNLKECGVSIDIYIVENVFDDPIRRFFQKNFSMAFAFAVSAVRECNNKDIPSEILEMEGRELHYAKSKKILGTLFKVIPLKTWIKWCEFWNSCCKDENSKMVSIPTGPKHFAGEMYQREGMCSYRKEQFETEKFNVPLKAEEYLKQSYGDYMQIPPEDKRERHLFLELDF